MDYEKWAECLSTLEPGETDLFRMVKGISFLWKKKKKRAWCSSLVIHEGWSVAEVKWWVPDLAHSNWFIRTCVNLPQEAHMYSEAQQIQRTYLTSQEQKSAWSAALQVSWGVMKLCELISSRFLASSFCAPQRWCWLGESLPYRGIRAVWESCAVPMFKNKLS